MPLGVVSDDDFIKEVSNSGSSKPSLEQVGGVIVNETPGRSKGDNNVPESLRKIIGEESIINGRGEAVALARMFGISDSSVSAYAKGATSTDSYNQPNGKLSSYLKVRKERLTKKAMRALTNALDEVTPEKLREVKVRDAAAIAKDMSAIVKNLEPDKTVTGDQQNNQFIFYAPKFMDEQRYDVVQVNE